MYKNGIEQFEEAIKEFKAEEAHQILLQICGISSGIEAHSLRLGQLSSMLNVIEKYFGKRNIAKKMNREMILRINGELYKNINFVWGLSNRKIVESDGYEVFVVVGYK